MNLQQQIALFKRIDYFIQQKATGTPEEFANKLGISRASVFRYLTNLKKMGAECEFCKSDKTYYYKNEFSFSKELL